MLGHKFHKLTVQAFSHKASDRSLHWTCICDCGKLRIVSGKRLRSGHTKSCGCVHGVAVSDPITQQQLKKLLYYDPETGLFTWLVDGRKCSIGDIAGHSNEYNKYVRIGIGSGFGSVQYAAHQLAWLYMLGVWAERIDHEDRDPGNNRWNNLREATVSQNGANSKINVRNKTGYKGVSFGRGKFVAKCQNRDVGYFLTAEEAARAYDAEAIKTFGSFASVNFGIDK